MNPFQVLQIKEGSSAPVAKKAFKKLAQKFHPDRNKDPGAEEHFKLIKQAYDMIMSGVFGNTEPSTIIPKSTIVLSFQEAFNGIEVTIPGTPHKVFVMPGTFSGHKERRLIQSSYTQYFDLEYEVIDPSGFYKFAMIDGRLRFCCHLKITSGQLLGELEHTIKNVNPDSPDIGFKVPTNYKDYFVIPHAGPRTGIHRSNRMDLYVIPIVEIIPLEQEIYPVLKAIDVKLQEVLKAYKYFK